MTDHIDAIEVALRSMGQDVLIGVRPPNECSSLTTFTVRFRDRPFDIGQGESLAAAWADACSRIGGRLAA